MTNWCSADLSVIDTTSAKEVARIPLRGQHPRGIAVSPDSGTYIALMGSDRLVRVDLGSGRSPTTPAPATDPGTSSSPATGSTSSSPTTATAPGGSTGSVAGW